ncbi:MAG: serine hydrolase [Anaerolineae bacterium]|nr:serine hydrolase [Anaerolineae bacterium]
MDTKDIIAEFEKWNVKGDFSGVFSIRRDMVVQFEQAYGYANYGEKTPNRCDTKMGIASGTKLFTALAILTLVEEQALSLDQCLGDILDIEFGNIDKTITVQQLLTHTSGIPDYFGEPDSDAFEQIWEEYPVYRMTRVADFLPLFVHKPVQFPPGQETSYSDSGFLLLGLVLEQLTQQRYQDVVEERILRRCGLDNTGFYYANRLPQNTALGHIIDEETGDWRTNIFAISIVGGPDGGIYTNVQDVALLWKQVFYGDLISPTMRQNMLTPYTPMKEEGRNVFYGLGIYIIQREDGYTHYYIIGGDPGVEFFSLYQTEMHQIVTVIGNTGKNIWPLFCAIAGNG